MVETVGALAKTRIRRLPSLADEDLISLIVAGEPEALAGLYDRHGRAAYSLARRMMRERQAAEDVVQDSFLKVWRAAGSYRPERGSARSWILSMVHNRGIDHLRSAAARQRVQDRFEVSTPKVQPNEAFTEAWHGLRREGVLEALKTLPSEQLKILELSYLHDHTHPEIAELLELPLGTVKGRMRLGLKKMRKHFGLSEQGEPA